MDYIKLTEIYTQLEKTTKRLEKTYVISEFIKALKKEENIHTIINLLSGKVFPSWDESKIGVSEKLVIKALSVSTGNPKDKIEKQWSKTGDLGEVAEELVVYKKQQTLQQRVLTVDLVFKNLRSLATLEGHGAVNKKMGLISELITSATPGEAKYIIRTLLEDLRIGVGEGSLRDAVVWAFFGEELGINYDKDKNNINLTEEKRKDYNEYSEKIQQAYDLTNDFGEVIEKLKEKGLEGLKEISLKVGKPINLMLAIRTETSKEAIEALGLPVFVDYKIDGFRAQIHKEGNKVYFFTRRLENVTKQFSELIQVIQNNVKAKNCILDAEIIGYDPKNKRYLPFQAISQRIKRKHNIERVAKDLPVEIDVFDIVYKDNKNLMNLPLKERRKILEATIRPLKLKIELTKSIIAKSEKEIEKFYKQSLKEGNEGVMIKNLNKEYISGRKVGGWVKLKPILESLDLVITKAEWGTGKRGGLLSSYTISCWDKLKDKLIEIGKVSTGLKEKESESTTFLDITDLLKPLIIKTEGKEVIVKPKVIIEIGYEEIQKSFEYTSGYALRFPRFLRLRKDKPLSEINTLIEIERIYDKQRGRK